jgi:hypothetical protein
MQLTAATDCSAIDNALVRAGSPGKTFNRIS